MREAEKSNLASRIRYVDFQQALDDAKAAGEYNGAKLSYEELANKLGVGAEGGRIKAIDPLQACLCASLNPNVQPLPATERIQIVSSATAALEEMEKLWERSR